MKKTTTLIFLLIMIVSAKAQISSLPYTEGFEAPFTQGSNVQFVPNFTGNTVAATNRICQDAANRHSGAAACAITPTSSFDGEVLVGLNLTGYSNVYFRFWAATALNGTGTRPAVVSLSTSIDNGATYSPGTFIGDATAFANANTSWNQYTYALPYYTNNNANVIIRITVTRGDGTGTAARWLLDDAEFNFTASDITPPTILDAFATSNTTVKVMISEPVNATGTTTSNYTGLPSSITSINTNTYVDTLTLNLSSPLNIGTIYNMTVSGIQDLSGNAIAAPRVFPIVYNDNTGNVVITEINYNAPGTDSIEFIELKNIGTSAVNVGGWRFDQGLFGFFPSDLILQPDQYIVFAPDTFAVNAFFNITSYPLQGGLNNTGEAVSFVNSDDVTIDAVSYLPTSPWDTTANGYGPSLVLCTETSNNDLASNWTAATTLAGNFGGVDVYANPMNNCTLTATIYSNATQPFRIYPNPVTDRLVIEPQNSQKINNIALYNLTGSCVYRQTNLENTDKHIINLSSLPSGIYTLKVDGFSTRIVRM